MDAAIKDDAAIVIHVPMVELRINNNNLNQIKSNVVMKRIKLIRGQPP